MKTPRRFLIPVGWNHNGLRSPEEHLYSTTEVLPVPKIDLTFEVERVPGSWSPHIPEKKPRYRITWGSYAGSWAPVVEVEPVRLGQLGRLSAFIVLRPVQRAQRCLVYQGWRHALIKGTSLKLLTFCGESPYIQRDNEAEVFVPGIPNCPRCTANGQGWVFYYAYPYEDKKEVKKESQKAKALMKRREKNPTAFDRILLDDPLDPPPKQPKEKSELPPPDVETDFERAHREAKLRARREGAEHFRQAKQRARKQ